MINLKIINYKQIKKFLKKSETEVLIGSNSTILPVIINSSSNWNWICSSKRCLKEKSMQKSRQNKKMIAIIIDGGNYKFVTNI